MFVGTTHNDGCYVVRMRTVADRLKIAMDAARLNQAELARAATTKTQAVTQQNVQQLLADRNKTSKHLPALARALGVNLEWLSTGDGPRELIGPRQLKGSQSESIKEQMSGNSTSSIPSHLRNVTKDGPEDMLRVLGMAEGGPDGWNLWNGEVVQYIRRPDNLLGVPNAYAVFITGHSMEPRYRPGEVVHVHPGKPTNPSDYVLVQRKPRQDGDPPLAVVKLLIKRTGSKLVLGQHNPSKEIEVPASEVVSVHRIVGSSEA